ncbi:hypothetical protein [Lacinutrix jangbogonensis]|uniref:hypothetical protein n=1 Tax=Lacinutrix jangbogonensis TaxID=1469557 RepID=UPI00053DFD93|nr:hypothetical protein [Lacinutrix jangbogonensis]
MKKRLSIIFISLIIIFIIYWNFRIDIKDYFISKDAIYWSEDVELKYSDFQADINLKSKSNIYYYYGFNLKANSIEKAYVRSYFDKDKSWIKDTLAPGMKLEMKIQKLIFDLNEVYVRKFNAEIDKIKFDKKTKFRDLENVGDRIYSELEDVEDYMFQSTNTDSEVLLIWRPRVDSLLNLHK